MVLRQQAGRNTDGKVSQSWIARPGDQFISHGKAVSSMLDAVAGKFTVEDLGHEFEHQVLISMCMVVVSLILGRLHPDTKPRKPS